MDSITQSQGYLYTFSKSSSFGQGEIALLPNNSKKGIILTLVADDHPYLGSKDKNCWHCRII